MPAIANARRPVHPTGSIVFHRPATDWTNHRRDGAPAVREVVRAGILEARTLRMENTSVRGVKTKR